eukprot:1155918-Pelagomonas_calceolata.AAC.12
MSGMGQQPGCQRASPWRRKVASVSDDLHITPPSDNGLDAEAGEDEVVQGVLEHAHSVLGGQPVKVAKALQGAGSPQENWQEQARRERAMLRTLLQGGVARSKKRTWLEGLQGGAPVTKQPAFTHKAASRGTLSPSAAPAKLSDGPVQEGDWGFKNTAAELSFTLGGQDGNLPSGGRSSSTYNFSSGCTQQQQQQQEPCQLPSSPAAIVQRLITEIEEYVAVLGQFQVRPAGVAHSLGSTI